MSNFKARFCIKLAHFREYKLFVWFCRLNEKSDCRVNALLQRKICHRCLKFHSFLIMNLILTQNLCYKMTEEKKFLFQFTLGLDTLRDVMAWYTLWKVMAYRSLGWVMAQFTQGQRLVHIWKGFGLLYTKEGYDNLEMFDINQPSQTTKDTTKMHVWSSFTLCLGHHYLFNLLPLCVEGI